MKSTYKRLGEYIEPCNEKNSESEISESMLRGISNQKHFQKAKTNTIGVDLTKYRIVRNGQFAFNRATTRNGDKISIALRQGKDCIVSPSYRIFKSKDENILNSEYLMMWFKRPEFDRYARYKSHGSAHEFFDYDEMCEVELPIPSIEKQRAIVKEYNTVVNRIKLNEQFNQKLEETAQALYKHWFVDFEFPSANTPLSRGAGGVLKPYKSSGGKMVYNKELKREIPEGWEVGNLFDIANFQNGLACQKYRPTDENFLPVIKIKEMRDGFTEKTEKVTSDIPEKVKVYNGDVLFSWSASLEVMIWSGGNGGLNQHIFKVTSDKYPKSYYYFELLNYLQHFKMIADLRKTTMGHITKDHLTQSRIAIPPIDLCNQIDKKISPILDLVVKNSKQNQKLSELRDWLLPMLMNGQVSVKQAQQELAKVAEDVVEYKRRS